METSPDHRENDSSLEEELSHQNSTISETESRTSSTKSPSSLFLPLCRSIYFETASLPIFINTIDDQKSSTTLDGYDLTEFHEKLDRGPDAPYSDQLDHIHVTVGKVMKKQDEVTAKRARARELRVALRNKRDEEGHLRAELLKSLNFAIAMGLAGNAHSMLSIVERFQTSSDAYLALENDYHKLEDQLALDEYDLDKMEQRLSSLLDRFRSLPRSKIRDQEGLQSSGADDGNNDSSSTSSSEYNKYPPLLFEYLSRVGDARILRERISNLECEQFEVSDKKESLSRLGLALDEESQTFLSSYEEQRSELQKELDDTEQDVARLKLDCEADGLLPRSLQDNATMQFYQTVKEGLPKKDDPLWSSELEDTCPFFERDMTQKLGIPTFINKWLLHQLRHSSIEIIRLKTFLQLQELRNIDWDEASISGWVLKLWFKDDTTAITPPQTPSATGT
ncbi:hypothetical protein VTN77DRAFT_7007 [Rasamsonia byssochlamydoides]|uniref:uncharacterized protein n=1 Tax=Rasamsonia byssochlamydoides TaxID=89139 RepID=UPI003743205C